MRCETMLPNHCQCTNAAVEGSNFCRLHLATKEIPCFRIEHPKEINKNTNQKVK